jgi:alpha-glucosidase
MTPKPNAPHTGDSVSWWKRGVVYQVYLRSFQDSNGDGIGDLPGIQRRLDYLCDLGVDVLWICPFYPSPMEDSGYDITDFQAIDRAYGTLADFDRLVAEAHRRDLKIVMDFVPNHTSRFHPWFLDSRASRSSRKRDWYIWRDAAPGGGPPTNWLSIFGGSAWEWDEATGQYYYHAFFREQPDLNWRNPAVRDAMFGAMRFWLERGIDGFRVDAPENLVEDLVLEDNPVNPEYQPHLPSFQSLRPIHTRNLPETHAILAEMRKLIDLYPDRLFIAEIHGQMPILMSYYGSDRAPEAHLPFNFQLIFCPWEKAAVEALIREYEAALRPGQWPNWVIGNHDRPRIATRLGPRQSRVAALLLLTLRGTPTVYNGEVAYNFLCPSTRVMTTRERT